MWAALKHGMIQAEIIQEQGRSIVGSLRQQTPLRASSPLYPANSGTVCFYIMNPAAGLLQGDRHAISIRVKRGAQAVILGQGATKIFRSPQGERSEQFTTLIVEQGARLEYMPEAVIPFAESCFFSRTNVLLDRGAAAFLWEITAPGRSARQERFAYTLFDQQTNMYLDRKLIGSDRFLLEPGKTPACLRTWSDPLGFLHGYSHMGTFWAANPRLEAEITQLRRDREEEPGILGQIARDNAVLLAGTALCSQAYCFRALGNSAEDIQNAFKELWRLLRQRLYNEPAWPWRKY